MSDEIWESTAKNLNYESEAKMWAEMYPKFSISALAQKFGTSVGVIRSRLLRKNVEVRKRGGPNNVKIVVNDELVDRILKTSIPQVAKEMNLSPQALYRRLYYKYGLTVRELKEKAKSTHAAALSGQLADKPSDDDKDQSNLVLVEENSNQREEEQK